jgi:hypothetical protein
MDGNFVYLEQLFKGMTESRISGCNNTVSIDSSMSNVIGGCFNIIVKSSCNSSIIGGGTNLLYCSSYSGIIGGQKNLVVNYPYVSCYDACQKYSTIVGGYYNNVCDNNWASSIIGGQENRILRSSDFSTIVGGKCNDIVQDSCCAAILSGACNTLYFRNIGSSIVGGYCNYIGIYSYRASITGGRLNNIYQKSHESSIIGGSNNKICFYASCSGVFTGNCNTIINGNKSTILGGDSNTISYNDGNLIGGSVCSLISVCNYYSTILGGFQNKIYRYSSYNSISGGGCNTIDFYSNYNSISNSFKSCITSSSNLSSIIGGRCNLIECSEGSVIIGGSYLSLNCESNTVLIPNLKIGVLGYGYSDRILTVSETGLVNYTNLDSLGLGNTPSFIRVNEICTITGYQNCITNSYETSIIGGTLNEIGISSNNSSIIGGICNRVLFSSENSIILAGSNNYLGLNSCNSSIIGSTGSRLDNYSLNSTIVGGGKNYLSNGSCYSTIVSGYNNHVCCSNYSSIISGYNNCIKNSVNSIILGGVDLELDGEENLTFVQKLRISEISECSDSKILTTDESGNINFRNVSSINDPGYGNIKSEDSNYSLVTSGKYNTMCNCSISSSIISGYKNTLSSSSYTSQLGGSCNSLSSSNNSSSIGGCKNSISGSSLSSIVGGDKNSLTFNSHKSSIIGGCSNSIYYYSQLSSIVGGCCNCINYYSCYSSIVGGVKNCIRLSGRSVILGGNNLCLDTENDIVLVSKLRVANFSQCSDSKILTADSCGNINYRDVSTIGGTGSNNLGLQTVLINDSLLTQTNTIDVNSTDLLFTNASSFEVNATANVNIDTTNSVTIKTNDTAEESGLFTVPTQAQLRTQDLVTSEYTEVTTQKNRLFIITPGVVSSSVNVGDVLQLTSTSGQVEYASISSLQGPTGADGPTGPAGTNGTNGSQGPTGPTAQLTFQQTLINGATLSQFNQVELQNNNFIWNKPDRFIIQGTSSTLGEVWTTSFNLRSANGNEAIDLAINNQSGLTGSGIKLNKTSLQIRTPKVVNFTAAVNQVLTLTDTNGTVEFASIPTSSSGSIINYVTATNSTAFATASTVALYSVLIPANTVSGGDIVYIQTRTRKSAANGVYRTRMYSNSTNNISTATLLGDLLTTTVSTIFAQYERTLLVKSASGVSNNQSFSNSVTDAFTDNTVANAVLTPTIDWTSDVYIIIGLAGANAGDTINGSFVKIRIEKGNI